MKELLFLSRVAFLYNLCMIAAFWMRYQGPVSGGAVQSTILVSGIVLSILFSGVVMLWMIVLLLRKTPVAAFRPPWLFVFNGCFFIYQLYLLLK